MVTETLFEKYPGPEHFVAAPIEEIEEDIRSTGTFRNKAKQHPKACRAIVEEHGGEVPRDMEALKALGGVGRKTANVVMGNIWNEPDGVVVDTHVTRLSRKLALTNKEDAVQIERELNRDDPARALGHVPALADLPRTPGVQGPQSALRRVRALCLLPDTRLRPSEAETAHRIDHAEGTERPAPSPEPAAHRDTGRSIRRAGRRRRHRPEQARCCHSERPGSGCRSRRSLPTEPRRRG